jgi:hypothetical protein
MAVQLINFSDNKLVLNNVPIDYDAKVITVIGKARLGKSSLLNIICSYINDKDQNIFKSSASIHHVTQGISYYYIEKHKILLIDSQGLDYANSSDDHKIMLLCYSISNIIIFNERTMFNNSSLNTLSQLASFVNRIDNITSKPKLMIRVSDYDLDNNINENISITMNYQDDQYNNIRKAMTTLFSDIIGISTNYLPAFNKTELSEHKYTNILNYKENNYKKCVKSIISKLNACSPKKINRENLLKLIDSINNNKNINHTYLDMYGLITTNQFLEFKLQIPKELYDELDLDGTQENYEELYIPREVKYRNIVDSFDKKFKLIPDEIKNKERHYMNEELRKPMKNALDGMLSKASYIKNKELDIFIDFNILESTINNKLMSKYKIIKNGMTIDFNTIKLGPNDLNILENNRVYINGKYILLKDIIFSIKEYYLNYLQNIYHIYSSIFIEQYKIYETNFLKLYKELLSINKIRQDLIYIIDKKINNIKLKSLYDIIYQKNDDGTEELLHNIINIDSILNSNKLDIDSILSDIYNYEISLINRNLPNYEFNINNTLLSISSSDYIEYISHESILSSLIENFKKNSTKVQELHEIFINRIFEYINTETNIPETKLVDLYKCLSLKYVKIVVNEENYKVTWVMNKLQTKINLFIPIEFIDQELNDIVKYNKEINNFIFINYNTDIHDNTQITTYLIDKLYDSLMVKILKS